MARLASTASPVVSDDDGGSPKPRARARTVQTFTSPAKRRVPKNTYISSTPKTVRKMRVLGTATADDNPLMRPFTDISPKREPGTLRSHRVERLEEEEESMVNKMDLTRSVRKRTIKRPVMGRVSKNGGGPESPLRSRAKGSRNFTEPTTGRVKKDDQSADIFDETDRSADELNALRTLTSTKANTPRKHYRRRSRFMLKNDIEYEEEKAREAERRSIVRMNRLNGTSADASFTGSDEENDDEGTKEREEKKRKEEDAARLIREQKRRLELQRLILPQQTEEPERRNSRRPTRKAAQKKVSYKEDSDDDNNDDIFGVPRARQPRLSTPPPAETHTSEDDSIDNTTYNDDSHQSDAINEDDATNMATRQIFDEDSEDEKDQADYKVARRTTITATTKITTKSRTLTTVTEDEISITRARSLTAIKDAEPPQRAEDDGKDHEDEKTTSSLLEGFENLKIDGDENSLLPSKEQTSPPATMAVDDDQMDESFATACDDTEAGVDSTDSDAARPLVIQSPSADDSRLELPSELASDPASPFVEESDRMSDFVVHSDVSESAYEEDSDDVYKSVTDEDLDDNSEVEKPVPKSTRRLMRGTRSRTPEKPGSKTKTSAFMDDPIQDGDTLTRKINKALSDSNLSEGEDEKKLVEKPEPAARRLFKDREIKSKPAFELPPPAGTKKTFKLPKASLFDDDPFLDSRPRTPTEDEFTRRPAPASPDKKLRSPTKAEKSRAPHTGPVHRQGLDPFWQPDVVNDYNDKVSPQKELYKSLKKAERLASPDKMDKESKKAEAAAAKAAKEEKKKFDSEKESLAMAFLIELDEKLTGGQVGRLAQSTGGIKIVWLKTLLKTAGRANWRGKRYKNADGSESQYVHHYASIELASKVITDNYRLYNTVAHEFCHLATYMISGQLKNPHGREFMNWGELAAMVFADKGVVVTTKHNYEIEYKYIWKCQNMACGFEHGRHSKSINTLRFVCKCRGKLVQIKPKPRAAATATALPAAPIMDNGSQLPDALAAVSISHPIDQWTKRFHDALNYGNEGMGLPVSAPAFASDALGCMLPPPIPSTVAPPATAPGTAKKPLNEYQQFVKNNLKNYKENNPSLPHKEIMQLISAGYKAYKELKKGGDEAGAALAMGGVQGKKEAEKLEKDETEKTDKETMEFIDLT